MRFGQRGVGIGDLSLERVAGRTMAKLQLDSAYNTQIRANRGKVSNLAGNRRWADFDVAELMGGELLFPPCRGFSQVFPPMSVCLCLQRRITAQPFLAVD